MTLKQKLVLKNIDNQILNKQSISLSKAMRDAGYTEQGSKAGTNYEHLRPLLEGKFEFDSEKTKKKIEQAQNKFLKDNDNTNYSRMLELEARISVPELRKQEITNVNPDKIMIVYGNKESPTEKIDKPINEDCKPL